MRTIAIVTGVAIAFALPCQAQAPAIRTAANPGSEAPLRRVIDGFVRNQPDFDDMTPALANSLRGRPQAQAIFARLGALTKVTFKNADGNTDVYEADFENGLLEWRIAPAADGKAYVQGFGFSAANSPQPPRPRSPRPETERPSHVVPVTWPALKLTPRLVTQGGNDAWPCFSPDGRTVLFSRIGFDRHAALYVVPAAGGETKPLAGIPAFVTATRPAWSAKGMIAFTGERDGKTAVWIANADGGNAHAVPTPMDGSQQLVYPSWYPDGAHVAAMDGKNLVIRRVDLASGATTVATDHAQVLTGMPSVSPDGATIAFAGQKNAGQAYDQEENVIWLVDAAGKLATLEAKPLQGRAPVWSPDGAYLSFESDRGPGGQYAIFRIRRDGTGLTQLTDYALNATHGVFSPDGRHMVFAAADAASGQSRIGIVDLP